MITFEKQDKVINNLSNVLKNKKVAIVGVGGLGSYLAEGLVRMGIGKLLLIDDDLVEFSNLSRQNMYNYLNAEDSEFKVNAALNHLSYINPNCKIVALSEKLSNKNVDTLKSYDLVLDGTDNLISRYLINDFCYKNNISWIYTSAIGQIGSVINFIPGKTPCFKCVFGEVNDETVLDTCDLNGIYLPTLTMITSVTLTESVKILSDLEFSKSEIRINTFTGDRTEINLSSLLEECTCYEEPEIEEETVTVPEQKYYLICSGDTIQVNTDFSFLDLKKLFYKNGFKLVKERDTIITFKDKKNNLINGFINGKIVFHNYKKDEILKLIS